jgi:hypothetical protein
MSEYFGMVGVLEPCAQCGVVRPDVDAKRGFLPSAVKAVLCQRHLGHEGKHQTSYHEWNDGDTVPQRRMDYTSRVKPQRGKAFLELTPTQRREVQRFAKRNRRYWKHKLKQLWKRGKGNTVLLGLQHSHGPEWLTIFHLLHSKRKKPTTSDT